MGDSTTGGQGSDGGQLIRPEDIENHNKDGGAWLVKDGKVYNVEEFQQEVRLCAC